MDLLKELYPERAAGGYSRVDGTIAFYTRVQALLDHLSNGAQVVDFGAGRGAFQDDPVVYRRRLRDLRGPTRTVIGVDVDPIVKTNPMIDEGRIMERERGVIPVADGSTNLIVSDFTWEHLDDPRAAAAEFDRILVPGGWICARTPNRWGYIAMGARLVPNKLHVTALRRLQPRKKAVDTFPTRYRLNTRQAMVGFFPSPRYSVFAYTCDSEVGLYAGKSRLLSNVIRLIHHAPAPWRSIWLIFIRKEP